MTTIRVVTDTLKLWQSNGWKDVSRAKLMNYLTTNLSAGTLSQSDYYYWIDQYDKDTMVNTYVDTSGQEIGGGTTSGSGGGIIDQITGQITGSIISQIPITIPQAQYLVDQLNRIIDSANAVKNGTATVESLQVLIVTVLNELFRARNTGELTNQQVATTACAIQQLAEALKKEYSNGASEDENPEMNNIIAILFIAVPLLLGMWALKNKEGVEKILKILETSLYIIIYMTGIVVIGGFVYWSVVSLINNNWDVGKALGSMTAVFIEEIIEGIFEALVDLVKALWDAITPKLEAGAVTDTGAPEWYDFISPIMGIAYIVDVTTGQAPNPFAPRTAGARCRSVIELRDLLVEIIKAKGGTVDASVSTTKNIRDAETITLTNGAIVPKTTYIIR